MRTVDVYIGTSIRGPGRRDGKVCYIMETLKADGEAHRIHPAIAAFDDSSESRLVLYALRDAMRRLNYGVRIVIHTECGDIYRAITNRWLWNWPGNGWKTSRNKKVKNSILWSDILNMAQENGHELVVETKKHGYIYWMRWTLGVENPMRGVFCKTQEKIELEKTSLP